MYVKVADRIFFNKIPEPTDSIKSLLEAAEVILPFCFSSKGVTVATRKNCLNTV